jgi:hypothetical protein
MSNLSTFTEIGLVDARASAGVLIVPSSSDIPGRVITYKDIYGAVGNSTIALLTSTGDTYEDGTNYRTLTSAYDFITLYAGSTTKWYTIGGTQFNGFRTNTLSNNAFTTSSITTNTTTSAFNYTNFLYPQPGLTSINTAPLITSNLLPINTTAISIGSITSNYLQVFSQSTITSNIVGGSVDPRSTIRVGNSLIPAYSTFRISTISLGNTDNRWFQGFFVSTITSSINADIANIQTVSTQNIVGFNLLGTTILSTQAIFCSSIQIGPQDAILDVVGPIRAQDVSTLTLQASTITSGTMTLDRLFGGPIATATTTGNVYPFTAGAQIGFGSNSAQLGFYNEGHFHSTFTRVIQPTLDAGQFSNIVYINGNISTPNMFISTITANTITASTIFLSTLSSQTIRGSNIFGTTGFFNAITVNTSSRLSVPFIFPDNDNANELGSTQNRWLRTFTMSTVTNTITPIVGLVNPTPGVFDINSTIRMFGTVSTQNQVVSSITMNTGFGTTLSMSTVTTNALTIGAGGGFINIPFIQSVLTSSIQINTSQLNTSNITVSTINRKLYSYASTIGIPASTFTLSGVLANNITAPLVLYSNVAFPHAGFFNITQSAIFSRTNASANVPQASIFYTPGIYPSTVSNVDGYASLPYLGNVNASTFTTLAETLYISTTQLTRNIIYSDPTGNAYSANLFMSPITLQYIPNNTLNPE